MSTFLGAGITKLADFHRKIWLGGLILVGLSLASPMAGAQQPPSRPNVVVIMADDLGYRDTSCYGCIDFETPAIDALAAAGVRCTQGYVTHPYCSPSRAGLLSGRYQQSFGHEHNPPYDESNHAIGVDQGTTLLPERFRQLGYRTGLIGKWHLGAGPPFRPAVRGFTDFYGFLGGGHHYFRVQPGGTGYLSPMWRNAEPTDDELTYLTDDLTSQAESFIDAHQSQPFCLLVMYNAPHAPDQVTQRYLDRVQQIPHQGRRLYAGLVQGVDEGVRRIVAKLEQRALTERTLVVFLSDNGGRRGVSDNRPLRGNKGWLHEGGIRVPLIASQPGSLPEGKTCDVPVSALDILPTALARAGEDQPAQIDGQNVWPAWNGTQTAPPHPTLYWRVSGGTGYAIRHGDWKLVRDIGMERPELYDLDDDVGENRDLASSHPELVAELTAAYRTWSNQLETPRWTEGHTQNTLSERTAAQEAGTRQFPMPWLGDSAGNLQ